MPEISEHVILSVAKNLFLTLLTGLVEERLFAKFTLERRGFSPAEIVARALCSSRATHQLAAASGAGRVRKK